MKYYSILFLLASALIASQAFVLFQESNAVNKTVLPEQPFALHIKPVFKGEKIGLNASARKGVPSINMLRFYLSSFVGLKNGKVVFEEKNSYHLIDLEDEKSLDLNFNCQPFDQLQFKLGIDSLTIISGAMGGDLDPTKGMFWTWQSGYVNFKIEGAYDKCPTRNHAFNFHLGGYLAPFQSVQAVQLNVPKGNKLQLQLDLTPFFEKTDWTKKYSIMSPCKEAVLASNILANSFSLHGE